MKLDFNAFLNFLWIIWSFFDLPTHFFWTLHVSYVKFPKKVACLGRCGQLLTCLHLELIAFNFENWTTKLQLMLLKTLYCLLLPLQMCYWWDPRILLLTRCYISKYIRFFHHSKYIMTITSCVLLHQTILQFCLFTYDMILK